MWGRFLIVALVNTLEEPEFGGIWRRRCRPWARGVKGRRLIGTDSTRREREMGEAWIARVEDEPSLDFLWPPLPFREASSLPLLRPPNSKLRLGFLEAAIAMVTVSSSVSCWSCRVPLKDELHVELEVLTYVTSGDDVELLVVLYLYHLAQNSLYDHNTFADSTTLHCFHLVKQRRTELYLGSFADSTTLALIYFPIYKTSGCSYCWWPFPWLASHPCKSRRSFEKIH
jgi:hypothetical protein